MCVRVCACVCVPSLSPLLLSSSASCGNYGTGGNSGTAPVQRAADGSVVQSASGRRPPPAVPSAAHAALGAPAQTERERHTHTHTDRQNQTQGMTQRHAQAQTHRPVKQNGINPSCENEFGQTDTRGTGFMGASLLRGGTRGLPHLLFG